MNSSGEEAQSGLTVLLCEILTAVYLSLFIHGLATHSSNELFRIVAHPLNENMWSAVFGGGVQTHSKGLSGKFFLSLSSSSPFSFLISSSSHFFFKAETLFIWIALLDVIMF